MFLQNIDIYLIKRLFKFKIYLLNKIMFFRFTGVNN